MFDEPDVLTAVVLHAYDRLQREEHQRDNGSRLTRGEE